MVRAGGFTVPGSVVKITMQDFMTYINETIWPGPAFNVTVRSHRSSTIRGHLTLPLEWGSSHMSVQWLKATELVHIRMSLKRSSHTSNEEASLVQDARVSFFNPVKSYQN